MENEFKQIDWRHFAGNFLLSLATLLLELSLMRVLSVALWYHFGFLVISTALLDFGASGVVLALIFGMAFGFKAVLLIGTVCYLISLCVIEPG